MIEAWNNPASLKTLSHYLMWGTAVFAILAALLTGARYYIDRRANELLGAAQRHDVAEREAHQRERESELRAALEVARVEQAAAKEDLALLEKHARGRGISSEQTARLAGVVRPRCSVLGKVCVTASNSNAEAQAYAYQFVNALRSASCAADLDLPIPGLPADVSGIHLGVRSQQAPSVGAQVLAEALSAAGIAFSTSPIKPDFFPDAQFVLVVGAQ